jgi:hypothetical protein
MVGDVTHGPLTVEEFAIGLEAANNGEVNVDREVHLSVSLCVA